MGKLRVVALLATYNERRFVADCLEHLREQGVETYLIDNCSTDDTVEIAESYLGNGALGIETLPRDEGHFDLTAQLRRKEELTQELDADWFVHLDADEVRLPPPEHATLAQALAEVDRQGYNAVNFLEFTFMPTREEPDHDHRAYRQTLRTYYPFCPSFPHQLKAWKSAASTRPDLATSGGHRIDFPGLRMYPRSFPMRHYLFLSVLHAIEKYGQRGYAAAEVESGWHGWRAQLTASTVQLPSQSELRVSRAGDPLNPSEPRRRHFVDEVPSVGGNKSPW